MPKQNYVIQKLGKGYMHYIALDAGTVKKFAGKEKRLICKIEDIQLHCALLFQKEIGYYIMISKANLARLNLKIGSIVKASFEKDTTELQFEENEALNEVLATDTEATEIWNTLTNGNKRSLIYWVQSIKNTDKQIERALKIAEKLKLGIKSMREIAQK
jgi:hypothetical protein